jgi:hypothetical protein
MSTLVISPSSRLSDVFYPEITHIFGERPGLRGVFRADKLAGDTSKLIKSVSGRQK